MFSNGWQEKEEEEDEMEEEQEEQEEEEEVCERQTQILSCMIVDDEGGG